MTAHERLNAALDETLSGLLSMNPGQIEEAERTLAEQLPLSGRLHPSVAARLRLARAAALQAAQLWSGCIPQPGYTAIGPAVQGSGGTGLSVTG